MEGLSEPGVGSDVIALAPTSIELERITSGGGWMFIQRPTIRGLFPE